MRFILTIAFFLLLLFCAIASVTGHSGKYLPAPGMKIALTDTNTMLQPVPVELIVSQPVNDQDVVVIKDRCVVHAKYSENELIEMEKSFVSADKWAAFYDDYSFYNDDVSMFIYERALVKTESGKKYIQFMMATGEKITVDRMKSAGRLFFFNPAYGVKQCYSSGFDRRKYENF